MIDQVRIPPEGFRDYKGMGGYSCVHFGEDVVWRSTLRKGKWVVYKILDAGEIDRGGNWTYFDSAADAIMSIARETYSLQV